MCSSDLGDTMTYSSTALANAAGIQFLDTADYGAGPVYDSYWEWGSGYPFDDGMDFWSDDDHWVWAYGLHVGGSRYLLGDSYDVAAGTFGNSAVLRSTTSTFDDVELVQDTDSSLHIVGCENGGGYLSWLHGDATELETARAADWDRSGVVSDTCSILPSSGWVLASFRSTHTLGAYTYADSTGLSYAGVLTGWTSYDLEVLEQDGETLIVSAEGSQGVYTYKDPDDLVIGATDADQVDVAMDSLGTMYVAWIDSATTVYLSYGEPLTGFTDVELDTTLAGADDLDVHVDVNDRVIVAVRDGNTIAYTSVNAY